MAVSIRLAPTRSFLRLKISEATLVPVAFIPQNILFITSMPLADMEGGGATAARSVVDCLRSISATTNITLLSLRQQKSKCPHHLKQALSLLRSLLSRLPSKSFFDMPVFGYGPMLREIKDNKYDCIVINGGALFFLAPHLPKNTLNVCVVHNIEHELYREQLKQWAKLPLLAKIADIDLKKLMNMEKNAFLALPNFICLSTLDAKSIQKQNHNARVLTLPTAFSYASTKARVLGPTNTPLRLAFLAKYSWWPNRQGIEWFIDQVLDKLPQGLVTLDLYGRGAESYAKRHPDIRIQGYVESLNTVWQNSDIIICPIHAGSGINIKLVESLYNRRPVLATHFATRGLPLINDPALVCIDTAQEWVGFLNSDQARRLAKSTPSESTVNMFSQTGQSQKLCDFFASLP